MFDLVPFIFKEEETSLKQGKQYLMAQLDYRQWL